MEYVFSGKRAILQEADGSADQTPDSDSQCQAVVLSTLSKDPAGQMLLFRNLSGTAAPFICGQHTDVAAEGHLSAPVI